MTLRMWVVYDHPTDYPDHFVARLWEVYPGGPRPTESVIQSGSLDTIQTMMEFELNLTRMDRYSDNDPKIVEIWV